MTVARDNAADGRGNATRVRHAKQPSTGVFAEELVLAMNDLISTIGLMRRELRDAYARSIAP
jgi:hypothetical protein